MVHLCATRTVIACAAILALLIPSVGVGAPIPVSAPYSTHLSQQGVLDEATLLLPDQGSVLDTHPELLDPSLTNNLSILADTSVSVTFMDEDAGHRNALGAFTFNDQGTGARHRQCPSPTRPGWARADRSSRATRSDLGPLSAGVSMGFFLIANGAPPGWTLPDQAPANRVYWTLDELNSDGARHAVLASMTERIDGA